MSFLQVTIELLEGLLYTFLIFGTTLLASLPLGLIISFGSMAKQKIISTIVRGFVWIIRGTPLMLQLIFFDVFPSYLSNIFGFDWYLRTDPEHLMMACIAFSIHYACYFSEIFRGGIQSIPKGQYEAAQVLGLTKTQAFFKIVFLQVVKRIIPPASNEIITLVKDTALASVVISVDLFTVAKHINNIKAAIWPIFYAGLFYLIVNGILTVVLSKIEKKLDYFKV